VPKVLVLNYFAAGPLRRTWSKKPSMPLEATLGATEIHCHLVAAAIPHLATADGARVDVFAADPCQTEDEAERSARAAATERRRASPRGLLGGNVRRRDFGQSPAATQQRARQGPALRDVQAHRKFRRGLALLGCGPDGFQGGHALSNGDLRRREGGHEAASDHVDVANALGPRSGPKPPYSPDYPIT
jgi:hypothetical protein